MLKKIGKIILKMTVVLLGLACALLFIPRLIEQIVTKSSIYPENDVPAAPVAIVFGAGLSKDGSASPVLRDRVKTAAELYFNHKVSKLLMSGDNSFITYNEPGAMRSYAIQLGVPDKDIVLDYAGRRTYDSCYRARAIFGVQEAVLVTQGFHLPRALLLCQGMGIKSTGVKADRRAYSRLPYFYWTLRELPAALDSYINLYVTREEPVLGDPEPIFAGVIPTKPW